MALRATPALLALGLLLVSRGLGKKATPSAGGRVAPARTGAKLSPIDWHRRRFSAAKVIVNDPSVAVSIVAHWSIETDRGRAEWNYNLGGIKALPGQQYVELRASEGGTARFAAYETLGDGARAYVSLLQRHYAECWQLLEDGPATPDWYVCLVHHGYMAQQTDQQAADVINARRELVMRDLGMVA